MAKDHITYTPQNDLAEKLPFQVCEAWVEFEQKRAIYREEGYYRYQVMQCTSGRGIFRAGGEEFRIEQGDVVYFEPGIPHSYEPEQQENWRLDWFSFRGEGIGLIKDELSEIGYSVIRAKDCRPFRQPIERLVLLTSGGTTRGQLASSAGLYELLTELISCRKRLNDTSKMTERLKPVIDYMKQNLEEPFEIGTLSGLIKVSPSYLCRLFLKAYNTTPVRYGNNLKLIRAAELMMRNPSMKVKEAALKLGYTDVSYFCGEFKRLYSVTPAVYREYYQDEGRTVSTL